MNITEIEAIKDALKRSGYLLENRVLDFFLNKKYHAEANHRYKINSSDEKFREIDVISTKKISSYSIDKGSESLTLYVHFFCECKNIPIPLAVFKSKGDTEKLATDWSFKFTNGIKLKEEASLQWPELINAFQSTIIKTLPARQYCGFTEKKNATKQDKKEEKLMAYHPDEFHNMLMSLITYGKYKYDEIDRYWNGIRPTMGRLDIMIPLVILQGNIIEVSTTKDIEIKPVNYYRLKMPYEINYNKSLSIDIITESYLPEYLKLKIEGLQLMFNTLKKELKKGVR